MSATKLTDLPDEGYGLVGEDILYIVRGGVSSQVRWPSPPLPIPSVQRIAFTGTNPTESVGGGTRVAYLTDDGFSGTPTVELSGGADGDILTIINDVGAAVDIVPAGGPSITGSTTIDIGDTAELIYLGVEDTWYRTR
jgi:hypothetical protein